MKTKIEQKSGQSKKKTPKPFYPWRSNQRKWTDTLFAKKLLTYPSLMTNTELARALEEHHRWRIGYGKYRWVEDPIREKAETEAPFTAKVLSRIMTEAIARLKIIGDMAEGRYKKEL